MVDVFGLVQTYALWIVLILVAFLLFGLLRGAVAEGAATYGVLGVAVFLILIAAFLWVAQYQLYAVVSGATAVVIVVLDAWSDRRANRRARYRLR